MHPHKILVFDFDGTLADSLDPVVNEVNHVMTTIGHTPLKEETIERFLTNSSGNFFKRSPLTRWIAELMVSKIENEQLKHVDQIEPVPQLFLVLQTLHHYGYTLGIVTSNSEVVVRHYLKKHGWLHLFSFIHGGGGIFGKADILHDVIVEEHLTTNNIVYIGDEPRDVEAAQTAGIKVAAVTWGFQPKSAFQHLHPNWLIDHPRQLLQIVKGIPLHKRILGWFISTHR